MTIDAVQTSLSAVKGTLAQLRENAQEIASASVTSNNTDTETPPTQQVQEAVETPPRNLNPQQNSNPLPQVGSNSSPASSDSVISALAENVELESVATAQIKTLSTALDVMGQVSKIGEKVDVRA